MDLSTILRNAKARKYKSKAEFAADLDLIWKNCFEYNSQEVSLQLVLQLGMLSQKKMNQSHIHFGRLLDS